MDAAIYVRVSTAAQEEDGTSLDTQEAACRRYATERGWSVDDAHVYREQFSGYTRERPLLSQLRTALRDKEVDAVVIYAIDRLSRNQTDLAILVDEMQKTGRQLACVTEQFEDSAIGKFIMTARAFAAELEREKIRERTQRGRREAAKRGKLPGGGHNLYGYRYMKGEGRREIDPETALVVREIFRLYVEDGLSLWNLAQRLTEMGIPSPTGNKQWRQATLSGILRNTVYIGEEYAFKTVRVAAKKRRNPQTERGSAQRRPREDWIPVPGATPRLISDELFNRAHDRLKHNLAFSQRNVKYDYLLRGRIRCGKCGYIYSGKTRIHTWKNGTITRYQGYTCRSEVNRYSTCDAPQIKLEAVDDAVWTYVQQLLQDPARILTELERQRGQQAETNTEQDLATVRDKLARLASRERKLLNLALSVDDDDEGATLFRNEQQTIKKQRRELHSEGERINSRMQRHMVTAETIADVEAYCNRVRTNLSGFTLDEKRLALEALNITVTVQDHGKSLQIDGYVPHASITFMQSARPACAPPARSHI